MKEFKFLRNNKRYIRDDKALLRDYLRRLDLLYRRRCRIPSTGNIYQGSIELYFQVQEFIHNEQLTTYEEVRSYYYIAYCDALDLVDFVTDEIHNGIINEVESYTRE
jgi:hypothetical protein